MTDMTFGELTVSSVVEDPRALFDSKRFFPDATEDAIAEARGWMGERFFDGASHSFVLAVQSYVVRTGGRTILIDTCVGNHKEGRRRESWNGGNWPWLDNLAAAGVRPEDVDAVVCTHLHVDHAGWNTRLVDGRWVPTFPNAEYLTVQAELDTVEKKRAAGPEQYRYLYDDSILPVIESGQVVMVEPDHKLAPGVCLEPSPGHTPGHVSVRMSSGGEEAVAIGDMMHHPIQATHPEWNSMACDDAEQARRTRIAFLERTAGSDVAVLAAHFDPALVERAGDRFRFVFDAL
jgi:glyoxylase-like metal-dependent hydrolase (beta-lactamase superfamily II)